MQYVPFSRPPAAWESWEDEIAEPRVTISVIDDSDAPQPTGLVDQHGTPLYRIASRARCGF
jgi:hypothetical protein